MPTVPPSPPGHEEGRPPDTTADVQHPHPWLETKPGHELLRRSLSSHTHEGSPEDGLVAEDAVPRQYVILS